MLRREPSSELFWMRRDAAVDETAQPQPALGDGGRHALGERHEQLGEVGALGGLPVAGHVGLADPDLGVVREPLEESRRAHDLQAGTVRLAGAAAEQRAVGHDDVDRHALGDLRQDAAGETGANAQHPQARPAQTDRLGHRERGRHGRLDGLGGLGGHRTASSGWWGRGMTGRRRNHSRIPCTRIRAVTLWVTRP